MRKNLQRRALNRAEELEMKQKMPSFFFHSQKNVPKSLKNPSQENPQKNKKGRLKSGKEEGLLKNKMKLTNC